MAEPNHLAPRLVLPTFALLVVAACGGAPVGEDVDADEGAATVVVANDPNKSGGTVDKNPADRAVTPAIDWSRIDTRRPWQRKCDPDDRMSFPSTYWVTPKGTKCPSATATYGTWRGMGPNSKGQCLYAWEANGIMGLFRQPGSELEAIAAGEGANESITATCQTIPATAIITKGKMNVGCEQACQCIGCGILYNERLYAQVPSTWSSVGAELPNTDGFVVFSRKAARQAVSDLNGALGSKNGALVDLGKL